ncbi:MAG TPA: hypothetical protein DCL44_00765 [Elusimicrobia bacterium]|nr:hypothetical protein [Elusimicrobiota bacterium]
MKRILIAIAATGLAASVFAEDFTLNTLNISDLKASQETLQAAPLSIEDAVLGITKTPSQPAPALDMTIKLPFKDINKRIGGLCDDMKVLDPKAPVLFRQGDHLVFTNVNVNYHGIDYEPTVHLKPVFEKNNLLGIKFLKVDIDMAFGPGKSIGNNLNKNDIMAFLSNSLTASITESIDEAFKANNVSVRSQSILSFTYDKSAWNLHAAISPGFVAPLLPGLINNVSLTSFSFDSTGFALSVKSGSASAIAQLPGYNLALSDGLLTNFVRQYSGQDFNLMPEGHAGGIKFRADGRMEVSGKVKAVTMALKPNIYFTIEMTPVLSAPNTILLRIEKVKVDKAYNISIPGFINNWLQGRIIDSVVTTLTTDKELAKAASARKIDERTVELKLNSSTFLPSFAKGTVIRNLKIGNGLIYLAFEL